MKFLIAGIVALLIGEAQAANPRRPAQLPNSGGWQNSNPWGYGWQMRQIYLQQLANPPQPVIIIMPQQQQPIYLQPPIYMQQPPITVIR